MTSAVTGLWNTQVLSFVLSSKDVRLLYPSKRDTSVVLSQYTLEEKVSFVSRLDWTFYASPGALSLQYFSNNVHLLGLFLQSPNDKFFYKVFFIGDS